MEKPVRNVDAQGCMSLLDPEGKDGKFCAICDLHARDEDGTRCTKCPFIKASAEKAGAKTRVACGAKFKQFGIDWECGIYNFFFFLYNLHLNWQLPPVPSVDLLGNFNQGSFIAEGKSKNEVKKFSWAIHHLDGNRCNNLPWNLLLVINTEHGCFHGGPGGAEIIEVHAELILEIRRRVV